MYLPVEGTRIRLSGYVGTVRYVGEVAGTNGLWLGVEWDDLKRGKHDGVKDGRRYFTCKFPGSGSFIRPSAAICYGTSFLQALRAKYIEDFHGSESQERVILGSSNGAIEVEAVNLDKIRSKFANLHRLREVSLNEDENVASCDSAGEIQQTCPNVRGLDLSASLLPSWDIVALIATEFPLLERLNLNGNRLSGLTDVIQFSVSFSTLLALQINGTLMSWSDANHIIRFMPNLRLLEMGYNRLTRLELQEGADAPLINPSGSSPPRNGTIETLNFDSNELTDWNHVCHSVRSFDALQCLILTSNHLLTISPLLHPRNELRELSSPLGSLTRLTLSFNQLSKWSDIDALYLWCPVLENLALIGNPLVEVPDTGRYARQFVVAKIPSLKVLDASLINVKERRDCELFYLSYIVRNEPTSSDADQCRDHPRWDDLCAKHGRPEEHDTAKANIQDRHDKLGSRLIRVYTNLVLKQSAKSIRLTSAFWLSDLNIYQCFKMPFSESDSPPKAPSSSPPFLLRVLPTMQLRTFRLKVLKSLDLPPSSKRNLNLILWIKLSDGNLALMANNDDARDLAWWGLEDGSDVFIYTQVKQT